jgi:hypothetical protein
MYTGCTWTLLPLSNDHTQSRGDQTQMIPVGHPVVDTNGVYLLLSVFLCVSKSIDVGGEKGNILTPTAILIGGLPTSTPNRTTLLSDKI